MWNDTSSKTECCSPFGRGKDLETFSKWITARTERQGEAVYVDSPQRSRIRFVPTDQHSVLSTVRKIQDDRRWFPEACAKTWKNAMTARDVSYDFLCRDAPTGRALTSTTARSSDTVSPEISARDRVGRDDYAAGSAF